MTERLHFHFSLSHIGEGDGNPLQCSCLENPGDGGAWWLPSIGSHRVGHDRSDLARATARDPTSQISCLQFQHLFCSQIFGSQERQKNFTERPFTSSKHVCSHSLTFFLEYK